MRRWWQLLLGIVIAGLALYVLVLRGMPIASGPPPMDDIDEASRERLQEVLREADRAP